MFNPAVAGLKRGGREGVSMPEVVAMGNGAKVDLEGRVTWARWVEPSVRSVQNNSFGVQLHWAPEEWFESFL